MSTKRNYHPMEKGARAVTQIVTNIIIMSFVHNKRQLNNTYGGKLVDRIRLNWFIFFVNILNVSSLSCGWQ
jgi:hypothetical protein